MRINTGNQQKQLDNLGKQNKITTSKIDKRKNYCNLFKKLKTHLLTKMYQFETN